MFNIGRQIPEFLIAVWESGKEIRRLVDDSDIKCVANRRRIGKLDPSARPFPLLGHELFKQGTAVKTHEFLSEDAIQLIDVASVDAIAVVVRREIPEPSPVLAQAIDR